MSAREVMTGAGIDLPAVPVPGVRVPFAPEVYPVSLCVDCVGAAHGSDGERGDPLAVPMSRLAGHEVDLMTDADGDTLAPSFVWGGPYSCDGCDTRLGGDRYAAQVWRRPVPALTLTDHAPRVGGRSLVTSWAGQARPGDGGDTVRPAVELTVTHDKARKAYTVTVYSVEYIERDTYSLTRMAISLRADGVPSAVRLATVPAPRVSVAGLARLRDEWRGHMLAALAGEPGPVAAEVATWVRQVTA